MKLAALLLLSMQAPAPVPTQEGFVWASPDGQELRADLYLPNGAGPFPVAVFFHGGGWSIGTRKQLARLAAHMADVGVAGFAVDYRLAPNHPYPAAWEDAQAAVKWVRDHAAEYRFDATRIGAVGSSEGGELAALLGTSGTGAAHVDAVAAFSPVLDLSDPMPPVSRFLGGTCEQKAAACQAASPVKQVHAGMPPFLILHGTEDIAVPYAQATQMVREMNAAGNQVELFTAEGGPHRLWAATEWYRPSEKAMETFLLKVFAK